MTDQKTYTMQGVLAVINGATVDWDMLVATVKERDALKVKLEGDSSFNPGAEGYAVMWEAKAKELETERDAALAALAQARVVLADIADECDGYPEAMAVKTLRNIGADARAALSSPAPRCLTVEQAGEVVARVFQRTETAWPLQTTVAQVIDEVLHGR